MIRTIWRAAALLGIAALLTNCRRPTVKPDSGLTISVPYEVSTLDPHAENRLSNFSLLSHLYEPLVTTDAAMSIKPCLAERWENPDLLTWIFYIRKGVKFHDGSILTADDVTQTFQRLLSNQGLDMAGYMLNISSVRTIDPFMVEVKTRQPMAILLNKLRFILIVPDHVATGWLASHVSGTGPYRLAEFQSMTSLSLTRHEGYWGDRPFLSKVTFRLARSPEQALGDLENGVSGMAQASRRDVAEKLSKRSDFTVHYRSSIFLKFLGYNTTVASLPGGRKNPLTDVRVRRAIHLAIDRPRLVAGLPSAAVPASQFVPPFIFGFSSSLAVPEWNLSAAKKLLAEAGYPDGFEAPLVVRRLFSDAAPSLVSMLFEAGIRLKVESLPDPEFFVRIKHDPAVLHISRFGCPTGDASDIFDNTVHSFDPARHLGSENEGRYANPALDRIIEDSAGMLDMGSRRSALQEIMTEAMRDLPVIPLYIDEDIYAMKSRLVWQPRNDNFILASEISLR